MDKHSKIWVADNRGMIGKALVRCLKAQGFENILGKEGEELDLTNQQAVKAFFYQERPEYVFLAAGKSGGILANQKYPAEFIYNNLQIQNNVIHFAYETGVKKLLFVASSCSYPRECPQPMQEEALMTGLMESTSEAYSTAKVAGIKMCQAYNAQYGANYISVIPINLYGPHDSFDPENSHVISALMRKIYEAKERKEASVQVWGTGRPRREFLHVDDFAAACIFLMEKEHCPEVINVGFGKDISIAELAISLKGIIGYGGELLFDPSKPDGTMQKCLDSGKLEHLGWKARIGFEEGIKDTYHWFKKYIVRNG